MKFGYARVSTMIQMHGNSLEEQKNELLAAGVPEANIISEQYTGKTVFRPKFKKLLATLQKGDELFCTKLDRFARNSEEGLRAIRELTEKGVKVYILNFGGLDHPFDNSPIGKFQFTMLLAVAEWERSMILERTAAGKTIARTKEGYREGRPPIASKKIELAMELLRHRSYREVTELTGISRATLYRYNAKRKVRENSV